MAALPLRLRAQQLTQPSDLIAYSLRIGVTGHRHFSDADGVRRAVENLLDQIDATLRSAPARHRDEDRVPHFSFQQVDQLLCAAAKFIWRTLPVNPRIVPLENQTPLEWTVISPLAKGADRIVVEAVLERSRAQLKVIAPFAKADYESDFTEPGDLEQFRELWNKASEKHELGADYGEVLPSDTEIERHRKQNLRNEGYFRVGRETVDACEFLIAIWNGQPAAGKGGTGDVVAYAIERGRTVFWIDSNNPIAAARMIVPKLSGDELNGPLPGTTTKPIPRSAKHLLGTFHQLAAYNRDPAHDANKIDAVYKRDAAYLRGEATKARLPDELLTQILDKMLPHYARADQLAIRYQELYVFVAVGLYSLAAVAVTIAVLQVLFFRHQLWLIGFEVLAMLAAVGLLRVSRSESWHEKWLHDRHLAEQLRMAMFTNLLEMNRQSCDLSPSLNALPFYHGPNSWVNAALRRIACDFQPPEVPQQHFAAIKRFVIDGWIDNQANWHASNAINKRRAAHYSHTAGLILFMTTLVAACLHWARVGHLAKEWTAPWIIGQSATALAIICPAWGAAVHAINALRERDRLAARSQQMASVLRSIAQRAEQTLSLEELRRQIDAARQVMATENLEWWISLSFRAPELPA
jgi:hypothetical protein